MVLAQRRRIGQMFAERLLRIPDSVNSNGLSAIRRMMTNGIMEVLVGLVCPQLYDE